MSACRIALLALVAVAVPSAYAFLPIPSLSQLSGRAPAVSGVSSLSMMRHQVRGAHLALPADQRKALLRSLTTEVIRHGRITTTLARAKAIRGTVDHMVSLAKEGSLHARRQALSFIYDKELVHALFEQAPDRYKDRNGGYCRVVRTMARRGDNSKMGVIELV